MLFKNSTTCTCFFLGLQYAWTPTRYSSSQCHNGIIQVLWLGIMVVFQLRHHREIACHSQPSVITTCQTGVGGSPHLTVAHSARQDMCQVTVYSKTYHPTSYQISRVNFFVLFFVPCNRGLKLSARLFDQTGHECRRQCQLLQPEWETVKR